MTVCFKNKKNTKGPSMSSSACLPGIPSHVAFLLFAVACREYDGYDDFQEDGPGTGGQLSWSALELAGFAATGTNGGNAVHGACVSTVLTTWLFPPFAPAAEEAPSSNGLQESWSMPGQSS